MKTKFILETSTLEDVLMTKYQDMKEACNVCKQTPCQCKKSDEKELAEGYFNHSIDDAFKMLDDLMRQERDLDIEPMLKRLSPELQKQLVQWAQTDGKAAVANDEYPEADWAARINKYLHGVAEGSTGLSIQQLATISDEALDNAYHYGRSTPGNTFGWQANLKSAAYAKQMIDKGVTDIEAISDAIHKGWNTTAQAFVKNPDQFSDTEKLKAAGKLEAKLQQRSQLMKQNYAQLPEEEKEKDRVVARALLQAIKGKQGVAEGSKELPQWKKDWYAKQKPNSWPKHPQPYHNPNWIDELSPEERKKLIGGKGVTEDQDDECPVHGSHGFPNLQADESACTCDFDKLANPSWPDVEPDQEMDEGSFYRQDYFDANKDSKVRRNAEIDKNQNKKQDYFRDPIDDLAHLLTLAGTKVGEKVKGMVKKPSELNELGANNPPQATGTSPAPTANTAANTAVNTSTLNPQEQKQLDDLLKKAGVVK